MRYEAAFFMLQANNVFGDQDVHLYDGFSPEGHRGVMTTAIGCSDPVALANATAKFLAQCGEKGDRDLTAVIEDLEPIIESLTSEFEPHLAPSKVLENIIY